jgi:hypothetical protein
MVYTGWHRHERKGCKVRVKVNPFKVGGMRTAYYLQDLVRPQILVLSRNLEMISLCRLTD